MKKNYQTWAYLNDEGKRIWGDIFPSGEVPVRSIVTQAADLEGAGEERVFIVEWTELTAEQQNAILQRLSKKSGAPKDVILKDIQKIGLPLREKYTNGAGTTRIGLVI
jgi:hypothetical protein